MIEEQIKELREKFFDECTDSIHFHHGTGRLPKVDMAPHNVFEWIKTNCLKGQQEDKWIDVKLQQPEEFQEVAFIVKSHDEAYNNRRMGGRYQGFKFDRYHAFTTPGIEFEGTHWMPLPELPKTK